MAVNVVSLTGGGCFCAIQARVLCGFHHAEDVDVWAGTSAGGAVALAMAAEIAPARIISFFHAYSPRIFQKSWNPLRRLVPPRYDDTALNAALQKFYGERVCAQLAKPALVTTHDLRHGVPQVIWTPGCPTTEVWKLARMTMSAQTYFRPFDGRADGGLFHNDPALAAIASLIDFDVARPEEISLFCLGSGRYVVQRDATVNPRRLSQWLKIIVADTVDGASVAENRRMARVFTAGLGGRFDEFEFPHSDMDFDDPEVVDLVLTQWREPARMAAQRLNTFFAPHRAVEVSSSPSAVAEGAPISPPAQEPHVAPAITTAAVPAPTRGDVLKGSAS